MSEAVRVTGPVVGRRRAPGQVSAKSAPSWPDRPVALVCMPFYSAEVPSIQIGLLAALAEQAGFPAATFHLNLDLAARVPTRDLDGSPPTVESALAFLGTKTYAFTEIDSVEAGPDRYFVSGVGAETGREAEAGPMSFTILCSN